MLSPALCRFALTFACAVALAGSGPATIVRGVVQTYTVLSAESVTEGHPAQQYFRQRFSILRGKLAGVLAEVSGRDADDPEARDDASALIALMDGLQVQWLLDPTAVDLGRASAFAIEAIVASVLMPQPSPLAE